MFRNKITFLICICVLSVTGRTESPLREKREARKCKDKFAILRTHTACQPPSPRVTSAGVTVLDATTILAEHNKYRSSVQPTATDMIKLSWDDEIAMIAQRWAETCQFDHDQSYNRNIPGRFTLGQNIGTGYTSWEACIKAWNDEVRDFTYNTNNDFSKVGHYTQLVNSKTMAIGCGVAKCGASNFHVCNYAPAGNIGPDQINKPYSSGQSCRNCSGHCSNKLCDCSGKVCGNGGTLDLGSCTCKCTQSFHATDTCQLACSDKLTEPYMCGKGAFSQTGCRQYGTVPQSCPSTCAVCPYGAYDYKEKGIKVDDNGSATIYTGYTSRWIVLAITLVLNIVF